MMDGACQQEARSTTTKPFRAMIDVMDSVRGYGVATGLAHGPIEMTNNVHQQDRDSVGANPGDGTIQWRSRYDGLVVIARLGDKPVAGISGPWSGQYALTWWDRPLPTRHLELFDSLGEAKREVEDWALRMRTGNYSAAAPSVPPRVARAPVQASMPTPVQAPTCVVSASPPNLLVRMRALLPGLGMRQTNASPLDSIERLRRLQECADTDISDLHFAARDE